MFTEEGARFRRGRARRIVEMAVRATLEPEPQPRWHGTQIGVLG